MGNSDPTTRVLEAEPVHAPGRRLGGRYRLLRRLGRGGMASVWLAEDERLGRPVAVKVLEDESDPDFARRFRREAKVAAGLQDPNLVPVYDYRAERHPYLVMEYVEGGSLAQRLSAGDPPDPDRLAAELLAALRAIHAAGVLHRDVKPENVLIDPDGNARLTDFGIALPSGATSITRVGQVIGTETYMAPELIQGSPASERSDLYALGMLLSRVPGHERGVLGMLVERLRDPDPERRPVSAVEAEAILERGVPAGEPTEPILAGVAAAPRQRGRLLPALGLLLAAGSAAAIVIAGSGDGGDGGKLAASSVLPEANPAPGSEGKKPKQAPEPAATEPAPAPPDGAALNDQGYALLQAGQAEAAVPILQRAVKALEGGGDELTYNYALFNLGTALVDAGRPKEAIPILEQRLEYPDQRETVAAELAAARAAAGEGDTGGVAAGGDGAALDSSGGVKPGKGPKKGKVPPGHSAGGDGD